MVEEWGDSSKEEVEEEGSKNGDPISMSSWRPVLGVASHLRFFNVL